MVRMVTASGAVTTIARRLFRVQKDTSTQVVDPGHIFDTAAALEDRVAAAEALLKSIQTAGTGVDYSQELAATIYELQKISDWYGTHPWEYYPLDSTNASVDETGAITTSEVLILTNYIQVPPSGKIEVSWTEKVGNNKIVASVWSADRSTFLGQIERQCRYDDIFSYVFPDNFVGTLTVEPGMWVRFQWPNKEDKNFTNMAFRDAYQPDYETVDAAIKALSERITGVEAYQQNMDVVLDGMTRAMDIPAEVRTANVFQGIEESVTQRTLTVSPYGWNSVWLAGTIPASGSTYSQLIPFAYTFNAGQTYTIYVTGQSEITGLLVRPYGANYVKQGGNTVSGIVNGGAVNFVPDSTITVNWINLWHPAGFVAEDTVVAGELFIMIVPSAYTTNGFSLSERIADVEEKQLDMDIVVESAARAVDVPAEIRAANAFPGIEESVTRLTLTASPYSWSSVWLSGTIPTDAGNYSGLIPFAYTFNAGQSYTMYATGQDEITGLQLRPHGASYVTQGGNTVSGFVNGGAISFVPDATVTVSGIDLWHAAGFVSEDTAVAGELVIMIVPGAYTSSDFSLSSVVNGIPRYWESALDTAIAKIQALDGVTGTHGDSFVFITDYHIKKNANRSAALIREIVASTAVDKVFYGGDTLDEQTAKAQAYALHRKFWRQFDGLRVFPVYGNHDNNDNNKTTDEDILTYNEVYSLFGKRVEKYGIDTTFSPDTHNEDGLITGTETTWRERWGHTEPLGNYYYFDNTPQKIRYIVLNGFFAVKAGDQGTWFRNTLNATPAGWTIVVLCHAWWQDPARTKYSTTTGSLINALDAYIKGGGAAKVACWIAGHLHYDYSEMIDTVVTSGDDAGKTYSFPVIITTCDSYLNDTTNMTLGTATEQAFDVIHIDTYNQTVKCTRVGAGEDRLEYSYGLTT